MSRRLVGVGNADRRSVPGRPGAAGTTDCSGPVRSESEAERHDRNLNELMQELRVLAIGVQVLLGFLLALPFSSRFGGLGPGQRALYVGTLALCAFASALLIAPVAFHRFWFRRNLKGRLVRATNWLALIGLAAVALAVSAAVLLVVSYVEHGAVVPAIAAVTAVEFAVLWFALPLAGRRFGGSGPG